MNYRGTRTRIGAPAALGQDVVGHRTVLRASLRLPVFGALVLTLELVAFALQLGEDITPFVLVIIPAAAALVVCWAGGSPGEVRGLLRRLLVWQVGARWYIAALGIPLAEKVSIDTAGVLLGHATVGQLLRALSTSALIVAVVVLVPALLEELGWRGFGVQTAVEQGHSPAWAAGVIGLIFLALHVPLYLPGHLYNSLPIWPLPSILLSGSIILTWIYLRTSSVLVTGLMHGAFNATVPLTWGLDQDWVWQARGIVEPLICIALLLSTRKGFWTRRVEVEDPKPWAG